MFDLSLLWFAWVLLCIRGPRREIWGMIMMYEFHISFLSFDDTPLYPADGGVHMIHDATRITKIYEVELAKVVEVCCIAIWRSGCFSWPMAGYLDG